MIKPFFISMIGLLTLCSYKIIRIALETARPFISKDTVHLHIHVNIELYSPLLNTKSWFLFLLLLAAHGMSLIG